jgi:hypothetical protein
MSRPPTGISERCPRSPLEKCHPERSKNFAKRSYCGVEGPLAGGHYRRPGREFQPRLSTGSAQRRRDARRFPPDENRTQRCRENSLLRYMCCMKCRGPSTPQSNSLREPPRSAQDDTEWETAAELAGDGDSLCYLPQRYDHFGSQLDGDQRSSDFLAVRTDGIVTYLAPGLCS